MRVGIWGTVAVAGIAMGTAGSAAGQAVVDFESVAVGTQFGSGFGQVPGDLLFTEDDIGVTIDNYTEGGFVGFNFVTIGGFTDPSFPTTPATINNVRLAFDLANLGFTPLGATFEYADFGGGENLVVNGVAAELGSFAGAPAAIGGVNVAVTSFPLSGGVAGRVTLIGAISSLAIGGQELGIDNVRFLADPVGDLNGDGFVGAGDLDLLLGKWNQKVPGDEPADLNGDGFIGAGDLDLMLGNWNAGSAPAAAVPEPATLALLGLGAATLTRRRR